MIAKATVEAIRKEHGATRLACGEAATYLTVRDLCDTVLLAIAAQDALLAIVTNVEFVRRLSLDDTRAVRRLLKDVEQPPVPAPTPDPEPAPEAEPIGDPEPEVEAAS